MTTRTIEYDAPVDTEIRRAADRTGIGSSRKPRANGKGKPATRAASGETGARQFVEEVEQKTGRQLSPTALDKLAAGSREKGDGGAAEAFEAEANTRRANTRRANTNGNGSDGASGHTHTHVSFMAPYPHLTAEDAALVERFDRAGLRSATARFLLDDARRLGLDADQTAGDMRAEAHKLCEIADQLPVSRETGTTMLADALQIVRAAEAAFESEDETETVVRAALRAAAADFELLSKYDTEPDATWYLRAERRCELAIAIDAFRQKHGTSAGRVDGEDERRRAAAS